MNYMQFYDEVVDYFLSFYFSDFAGFYVVFNVYV